MPLRSGRLCVALFVALNCASLHAQQVSRPSESFSTRLPLVDGIALPASPLPGAVDRVSASAVDRISVNLERDGLPADGQTPAKLSITVMGKDGQPLPGETLLTVESDGGRWRIPGQATDVLGTQSGDLDRSVPGVQITAVNGRAEIWLLAPIEPRAVNVRIGAGAETASGQVTFVPELREMLAVGLVDGILSADAKSPLQLNPVRRDDGFEQEIRNLSRSSSDGKRTAALRGALFLKGKISGKTLLTLAYDSDKPSQHALFRDINPERWYPVYGDASIVGFEARSSSRLYVRVDNARNYLLYGDIATGDGFSQSLGQGAVASTRQRNLGQYNRMVTGARAHLEGERGVFNAFAAYDRLRQQVDEFPGGGVSGPYTVRNSTFAILGSERVELVTRDRNAPSVVLSTTPLQRFADYMFEPFSGRLLFKQAIPSVDANLNPVSVRITYEVDQGGERYWLQGVDGQVRLGSHLELGGSAVHDANPQVPYDLASVNARLMFSPATALTAEYARSRASADISRMYGAGYFSPLAGMSTQRATGDAWRLELTHAGERNQLRAYYSETGDAFYNPSASMIGSRREAGIGARVPFGAHVEGYLDATYSEARIGNAVRESGEAGLRWIPNEHLKLEAGLSRLRQEPGAYAVYGNVLGAIDPVTGAGMFNTGSGWMSGAGNWSWNGLQGVELDYLAAHLGIGWTPGNGRWTLNAKIDQAIDGRTFRHAMAGASYQLFDKTRLSARYEDYNGTADASLFSNSRQVHSSAFVFGVESEYMKGGTLFSEYRMYDAISGRQAQWANGLRNTWEVSPTLRLQTSAERLHGFGATQSSSALALGAEWRPDDLWQYSGRLEWRSTDSTQVRVGMRDPVTGQVNTQVTSLSGYSSWLSTLSAARKVSRDWTALLRNYYLSNRYAATGGKGHEDRLQLGIAYRDTDSNKVNLLGMYQFWQQRLPQMQNANLLTGVYGLGAGTAMLDPGLTQGSEGFDKHIASVSADWHPDRNWWFTGKLAGKAQRDLFRSGTSRFIAYYVGSRITYDFSERWDVSLMGARMWTPGGAAQHALGVEVGRLLTSNLWLSAGYNVRGFRDTDLAGSDYTNRGVFLRLRFKFDETLFRGSDTTINRTLPRTGEAR